MAYGGRYVITFNGEIYNYIELRQQLCAAVTSSTREPIPRSSSPPTTPGARDCVSHFNGMWAFAIHDSQAEIFCCRDRFGVKPFYYADTPGKFVFGSEIKQILAGAGGPAIANMIAVRDFLVEGYHGHTSETFFTASTA